MKHLVYCVVAIPLIFTVLGSKHNLAIRDTYLFCFLKLPHFTIPLIRYKQIVKWTKILNTAMMKCLRVHHEMEIKCYKRNMGLDAYVFCTYKLPHFYSTFFTWYISIMYLQATSYLQYSEVNTMATKYMIHVMHDTYLLCTPNPPHFYSILKKIHRNWIHDRYLLCR